MSVGETTITVVGNLAGDPEMRVTPSGVAMVRFRIASTPRSYNKNDGQWQDGTTMFLRCTAWRDLAENVSSSLTKGTRVVVTGRLRQQDWETPEGEKRSMLALEVDDIGPSLRFATAKPTRVQSRSAVPANDAWNIGAPAPTPAVATSGAADNEPPF
ncbi:single-stranded DNA-binding protein [Streptomyces roseoverticillatus]|uniref:single-stranded DNA-binding protein n=1 Tax=Streptomyces roseoverticillatus TaxID=66429 RepID=UPI0004C0EAF8|nr:single-stranded DNA-binding protein [Streptomyces roseoverticillatus]